MDCNKKTNQVVEVHRAEVVCVGTCMAHNRDITSFLFDEEERRLFYIFYYLFTPFLKYHLLLLGIKDGRAGVTARVPRWTNQSGGSDLFSRECPRDRSACSFRLVEVPPVVESSQKLISWVSLNLQASCLNLSFIANDA